jgi:hypothetical protein
MSNEKHGPKRAQGQEGSSIGADAPMPDKNGLLAERYGGEKLPLQVCRSRAGYYIGTKTAEGGPYSRESKEYWRNRRHAEAALAGRRWWTQRERP